jgi:hypothetical protein
MPTRRAFKAVLFTDPGSRNPNVTGIEIPFDVLKVFGTRGRVPVSGTINGFAFRSSLAPYGGKHFMAVNRQMREGAKAQAGDTVHFTLEKDEAVREVVLPADFQKALARDPAARAAWAKLSYTHRKEWVQEIEGAKRPETRERRLAKALAALASATAGKRK